MTVELIYDTDCPNVPQARANLAAALAAVGREPRWTEWDRSAVDSPPYVSGYGSPTILVAGKDVAGVPAGDGGSCCRLYSSGSNRFDGAPSAEQITAALRSDFAPAVKRRSPTSAWTSSLATFPAIAAALLPVGLCPACWPAYAGLLSALGLGFLLDAAYLFPLTAAMLVLAIGALVVGARSRRGYGPFCLGAAASAVTLLGKFAIGSDAVMYGGIAALIAASIWNAWPLRKNDATCPACTTG